jgi:hypothetical protein
MNVIPVLGPLLSFSHHTNVLLESPKSLEDLSTQGEDAMLLP